MNLDKGVSQTTLKYEEPSVLSLHKPTDIGSAVEDVIQHIGVMGTYQRLLFIGMLPFGISWAFAYFGQMFLTATPQEHWCHVPELKGLSADLRRNLSIPGGSTSDYDHCNVFEANWTLVLESRLPPDPSTPTVPCPDGWEFLFDDIPYPTIVSEREWVCNRAYLVPLSQTIYFLGSMVGGILCGYLADAFGRVPALVVANLLGFLGGVATMFTTGFWDFSICRFILGMSCDSLFIIFFILVIEYVGTGHRTWVSNMSIALYFGTGCMILPWIAFWISDWRIFTLAISLPMLVVLVVPFLVPESIRWLVSKGKIDRAVSILRRFEKVNRIKIPQDVMDAFVVLFTTPSLRSMLVCLVVACMSVSVLFDGLCRLSETLGLDFFITFTVMSATEVPSILVLVVLLDRFGRRKLTCLPLLCGGLISFAIAFVPRGVISVALATAARFFTNMSYVAIIQWTPELLPTGVRVSGASLVHISASAAIAVAPFIVFSERVWDSLPLILLAAVALAGGGMALLLPETAGRPMPQTIEDYEELAKTRPYQWKKRVVAETSSVSIAEKRP